MHPLCIVTVDKFPGVRAVSSIRPLATITFLVCVGVVLYLRINETEPVLPEGVGEFALEEDMGMDDPAADAFGTSADSDSSGSFAIDDGSGPPPFAPAAPQAYSGDAGGPPPAWTPPVTSAPADASASNTNAGNVAAGSQTIPEMPELPAMDAPEEQENLAMGNYRAPSEEDSPVNYPAAAGTVPTSLVAEPAVETQESLEVYDPSAVADQQAAMSKPSNTTTPTPQTSLFAATRVAVQAALDRGELSQALLLLSDWDGDPSLTAAEAEEVSALLGQLAGSVIYSSEPRLEAPYLVQAGETLPQIAAKYDVPWQLLAKINGLSAPDALQTGQSLKVIRGPFNAKVDISSRELTLMLGRRYAGRFQVNIDPSISVEEGSWLVDQKLITPAGGLYGNPNGATDSRSIVLSNPSTTGGQVAVIRGPSDQSRVASEPTDRTISLREADATDLYDILSVGSRVTIQR